MRKITLLLSFVIISGCLMIRAESNLTTGSGTQSSPYTVSEGIANQGSLKWITGYIVGYLTPKTDYIFSTDTCTQTTNLLISDLKTETDATKCLAVQLPTGAIRTGLNLFNNKSNLGKQITIYGSLETYFLKPGLKSPTYYVLEGGTSGGTKPIDTSGAIFAETFASNLGAFTNQSVIGAQVWTYDATYKCSKMTGYVTSVYNANEDWLISPTINLIGKNNATLVFEHAGNYFGTLSNETTLWISDNYIDGAPSTANWTELTIPTNVTNINYTFVNSGSVNLADYTNKSIRIAFKYVSTTTKAGTWEIKNFAIFGQTTGTSNPKASSFNAYVNGKTLELKNVADGSTVEIFNALGAKLQSSELVNGAVAINLSKGLYVVRVGKNTQKFMVK